MKSLIDYILHNTLDKTYNRVIKAAQKYPGYSVFEYQHGINSVASQKYREKHPELKPEYIEPEYIEPERLPPEPLPKIFCYRDYLGGARGMYYGVNLYFIERYERGFFEDVRELFADELTTAMMAMDYDRSSLSECDVDDIGTTSKIAEFDFIFEISNIKKNTFQYWGHYHDAWWTVFEMFGDFDGAELDRILKTR